jgi:hypothetical protein
MLRDIVEHETCLLEKIPPYMNVSGRTSYRQTVEHDLATNRIDPLATLDGVRVKSIQPRPNRVRKIYQVAIASPKDVIEIACSA